MIVVATISKSRFDKPIVATTEDRPTVKAFQAEVEAAQAKRRHELAAAAAAAHAAEVKELGDKVDEVELSGSEDEHGTLLVSKTSCLVVGCMLPRTLGGLPQPIARWPQPPNGFISFVRPQK